MRMKEQRIGGLIGSLTGNPKIRADPLHLFDVAEETKELPKKAFKKGRGIGHSFMWHIANDFKNKK
jgi:hypothetical protein